MPCSSSTKWCCSNITDNDDENCHSVEHHIATVRARTQNRDSREINKWNWSLDARIVRFLLKEEEAVVRASQSLLPTRVSMARVRLYRKSHQFITISQSPFHWKMLKYNSTNYYYYLLFAFNDVKCFDLRVKSFYEYRLMILLLLLLPFVVIGYAKLQNDYASYKSLRNDAWMECEWEREREARFASYPSLFR